MKKSDINWNNAVSLTEKFLQDKKLFFSFLKKSKDQKTTFLIKNAIDINTDDAVRLIFNIMLEKKIAQKDELSEEELMSVSGGIDFTRPQDQEECFGICVDLSGDNQKCHILCEN